ncbi:PAP2 family protein [Thermophagus sp. OGC60D27]|uniref:PAP2 family protein n=1 Tax=Thermophagus sp. OGC60D27 TaxID=3458415 RepID=UPI00403791D0
MKLFSKILSFLFHPMLMPTLGTFFILNSIPHHTLLPFAVKRLLYIIVFTSTCLLPLSLLPLFLQVKLIKSFEMKTSRERIFPALASAVFYFLGYYILSRLNISTLVESFQLASLFAIMVAAAISYYWKISLHALAAGGITGLVIAIMFGQSLDLFYLLSLIIIISGIISTARLYLNAHSPSQVYVGYLTGIIVVTSGILITL